MQNAIEAYVGQRTRLDIDNRIHPRLLGAIRLLLKQRASEHFNKIVGHKRLMEVLLRER